MEKFKNRIIQAQKEEEEKKRMEEQEKQKMEQLNRQKDAFFQSVMDSEAYHYLKNEIKDPRILNIIERALIMLASNGQIQQKIDRITLLRVVRRITGEGPHIRVKRSDDEEAVDLAKKLRLKDL